MRERFVGAGSEKIEKKRRLISNQIIFSSFIFTSEIRFSWFHSRSRQFPFHRRRTIVNCESHSRIIYLHFSPPIHPSYHHQKRKFSPVSQHTLHDEPPVLLLCFKKILKIIKKKNERKKSLPRRFISRPHEGKQKRSRKGWFRLPTTDVKWRKQKRNYCPGVWFSISILTMITQIKILSLLRLPPKSSWHIPSCEFIGKTNSNKSLIEDCLRLCARVSKANQRWGIVKIKINYTNTHTRTYTRVYAPQQTAQKQRNDPKPSESLEWKGNFTLPLTLIKPSQSTLEWTFKRRCEGRRSFYVSRSKGGPGALNEVTGRPTREERECCVGDLNEDLRSLCARDGMKWKEQLRSFCGRKAHLIHYG